MPWQDFIREVVRTVKERGMDKVVILNQGEPSESRRGLADGIMIESYICTHAAKRRWHNWDRILQWAKDWGNGPDQIVALSYIGFTSATPREDAFYCHACARLSGFLWADWYGKYDDYKDLFALRLGELVGKMQQRGPVYFRVFEKGVVVVNAGKEPAEFVVPSGENPQVEDKFSGKRLEITGGTLRV